MDTYQEDPQSPSSLHRYLYTSNNPVNQIDPTGQFGLGDISVSFAVFATIVAIGAIGLIAYHYLHHYDMGLYFANDFYWVDHLRAASAPRQRLSADEISVVKQNALQALRTAFAAYPRVRVHEGRGGDHTVEIDTDYPTNLCGGTKASPSDYSFLKYTCILANAEAANGTADRATILPAIGWGIGTNAAHEIGHQLALSVVNADKNLPGKYDNHEADDPLFYIPGAPLQWTDTSLQELGEKLD